jgi:hypothetical protein
MGLKKTELYTFCTETKEDLFHIFGECNDVHSFWVEIGNFFENLSIYITLSSK